jgi:hypothetical protein
LPALATQLATCSIAFALVKLVEAMVGAATACGKSGPSFANTGPIRLPGKRRDLQKFFGDDRADMGRRIAPA